MERFEIIGGRKLSGTIEVRGSKNAATPIIAATVLTREKCVISNMPLIEDVFSMLEILKSMGAEIEWLGKRKVAIRCLDLKPEKIDFELMKKIRSSILLLGPLSARFKKFKMYHPGGCVIGARPVDTHLDAMWKLGVRVKQKGKVYEINADRRKAGKVILRELSVTGTENAMMLAAGLPGKTIIKIAAAEPHVENLGEMLAKMGVKIKGLGTHTIEIIGHGKLGGVSHSIIPDANEAATFLIMGVATQSPITVTNTKEEHLDLILEKLREFGAGFKIGQNKIQVIPAGKLRAVAKVDTRPYPGIPTDVQAPFGILATQAEGTTLIHDSLYEGRFNYIGEIVRMGAKAKTLDVHRAEIHGPAKLKGKIINSFDLRAGASLIIAALIAKGKTIIENAYQVDRGYERIEERLQKLGAEIKRVKSL